MGLLQPVLRQLPLAFIADILWLDLHQRTFSDLPSSAHLLRLSLCCNDFISRLAVNLKGR